MARIRTIKPDFWTDEAITECSLSARLLFIGMWNFADDHGGIDGSPKQLKMKIFPADSIKIEPLLIELITHGLLMEYSVDGRKYLHIKGFTKHQFINRPSKPVCPLFEESMITHGGLNEPSYTIGKGREGNRKGKDTDMSSDLAIDIISCANRVLNKNFKGSKEAISHINKRIKEGRTIDEFTKVCENMLAAWGDDPKMSQYLCLETLFGEKFDKYLNISPVKAKPQQLTTFGQQKITNTKNAMTGFLERMGYDGEEGLEGVHNLDGKSVACISV